MFFEKVPVTTPVKLIDLCTDYGLSNHDVNQTLRDPRNAPWTKGQASWDSTVPSGVDVFLPIDHQIRVFEFRRRSGTSLRPLLVDAQTKKVTHPLGYDCTEGVTVRLRHTGVAGRNVRWIQTVRALNSPDRLPTGQPVPESFVDGGTANGPFVHAAGVVDPDTNPTGQFPVQFEDTPCGPRVSRPGTGKKFTATTSVVVVTGSRITIVQGCVWGYEVTPTGGPLLLGRMQWPVTATAVQYEQQKQILVRGVNAQGVQTNIDGRFKFRVPPDEHAVNA